MDSKEIRNKVLLDLFVSPETLIPMILGVTLIAASIAFGSGLLALFGLMGAASSVGVFFTKMIYGLDELTERAYDELKQLKEKKKQKIFNSLKKRVMRSKDKEMSKCLTILEKLTNDIREHFDPTSIVEKDILEKVEKIFHACVEEIKDSYKIYRSAMKYKGDMRVRMLSKREPIITEVKKSIELLTSISQQFYEHKYTSSEDLERINQLRKELEESMEVARNVEENMREFRVRGKHNVTDF